jgi:nucleoside 2-deoxyribosyltransferase
VRIYWAAPLFSVAERMFNNEMAEALHARGHEVFLPQESEANDRRAGPQSAVAIFDGDLDGLVWCEVVVACLDGPDPDSGTCWECGWAYEKRPVVAFRTDVRIVRDGMAPLNIMLAESSEELLIFDSDATVVGMADAISTAVKDACEAKVVVNEQEG